MQDLVHQAVTAFMGFFAIMNPVANTPIFLGLTAEDDRKTRRRVALKAVWLAFLIVVVCCVAGKLVFEMFGITLPALRIAGGVLVFVIGFHMLQGNPSSVHSPTDEENARSIEAQLGVAVSPLAIPILAGPGTIATAMSLSANAGFAGVGVTVVSFALLCGITFGMFVGGERFVRALGDSAVKVVTRVMGLILAVIGAQMLIEGVYGAVRQFTP